MSLKPAILAGTVALALIGAAACGDSENVPARSAAETGATAAATTAQEAPASPVATAAAGAQPASSAAPAAARAYLAGS